MQIQSLNIPTTTEPSVSSEMSEYSAMKVEEYKRELSECEGCTGLPCQKKYGMRECKPVLSFQMGSAYVSYGECEYFKAKARQAKISQSFKMAKLPRKYIGKTFANYEVNSGNKKAVELAREAVKTRKGLYLYGNPGVGKTYLAAIIAQEQVKAGRTVIFGDVPSLLEDMRSTFADKDSGNKLSEMMESLVRADVLILDDLGTESPTEWAVERLYLIINQRYVEEKTVIVTTNFAPSEVKERLNNPKDRKSKGRFVTGDRIMSRLMEMCEGAMITGRDRRFKGE